MKYLEMSLTNVI